MWFQALLPNTNNLQNLIHKLDLKDNLTPDQIGPGSNGIG